MKRNKPFSAMLSLFLAVTMAVQICPSIAFAKDTDSFATKIWSDFQTPPPDIKSRPLWFWNDEIKDMSDEKLEEIVEKSFYESGYYGFGILPNWLQGYMSDEYLDKYEVVVKKAKELGMKLCLYDEDGFPSYTAGGLLGQRYPEYTAKRLDKFEKEATGPAKVVVPLNYGTPMGAVAMNTATKELVDISDKITMVQSGGGTGVFASSYYTQAPGYDVFSAFDGNYNTRWNGASFSGGGWLEVRYTEPTTFDRVDVMESMNRITSYNLQYWNGNAWVNIASGDKIGDGVKKSFTFDAVTSTRVRFLINSVTADSPSIYEMEVFNNGAKLPIPPQNEPVSSNLTYDIPAGTWKVMAFICVVDGKNGMDYLDKESVAKFIEITHQTYYDRFPEYFGTVFDSAFYDEPTFWNWGGDSGVQGARMWTPGYNDAFVEQKGYNPVLLYPALWYDIGADTNWARNELQDVRTQLFAKDYIGQLNDWCEAHNIELTGHMLLEEIQNPVGLHGDLMKVFKYQDIPGVDVIGSFGYTQEAYKIISSAAYNWDKGLVMTESYGAMGEGMGIPNLYRVAMDQYAKGVNLMVPHAIWYNNTSKVTYPPELSYRNPVYGPELWRYNEYMGRLQMLLQNGRHVADIGLFYPIDYLKASFKFTTTTSADWGVPADNNYMNVGEALSLTHRKDFTYIHPEVLDQKCTIENGVMNLNNEINFEQYKVFVMPATRIISLSNAQKIKAFYDNGGKVISVGQLPYLASDRNKDAEVASIMQSIFQIDPATSGSQPAATYSKVSNANNGVAIFMKSLNNLGTALNEVNDVYDVSFNGIAGVSGGNFTYIHKVKEGTDIYFFANSSSSRINGTVDVRGTITPSAWDPMTGTLYVPSYEHINKNGIAVTRIKLDMEGVTSLFILDAPAINISSPHFVDATVIIDGVSYPLPFSGPFSGDISSIEVVSNDSNYEFAYFSGDLFSANNPLTVPSSGINNLEVNFKFVHGIGPDDDAKITIDSINGNGKDSAYVNGELVSLPFSTSVGQMREYIVDPVAPAGTILAGIKGVTPAYQMYSSLAHVVANKDVNLSASFAIPLKNVALNKPVSANDSANIGSAWGAANLTDGATIGTGVTTGIKYDNLDIPGGAYFEIDLGKNESIQNIVVYPRTDAESYIAGVHYFPQDYTVKVKADGASEYITIADEKGHPDTDQPISYRFAPIQARYIRITATKMCAQSVGQDIKRFQLAEMEVLSANYVTVNNIDIASKSGMNSIFGLGESLELSATVSPANAEVKDVKWYVHDTKTGLFSDKAEIIMKNGTPVVVGVKPGEVDIYARSQDGSGILGKYRVYIYDGIPVEITSITAPAAVVAGCAANIPITIEGNYLDEAAITVSLFGKSAEIVDNKALIKLDPSDIPAVTETTTYYITASIGDTVIKNQPIKVQPNTNDLWALKFVANGNDKLDIVFGANIEPKTSSFIVKVNGQKVSYEKGADNVLTIDIPASEAEITVSGVKFKELFPSYSFTLSGTYK